MSLSFWILRHPPNARATKLDMVRRVAETVFIPFTVGGGSVPLKIFVRFSERERIRCRLIRLAIANPTLISEAALKFGSQCVVVAIDAKRRPDGGWNIYTWVAELIWALMR